MVTLGTSQSCWGGSSTATPTIPPTALTPSASPKGRVVVLPLPQMVRGERLSLPLTPSVSQQTQHTNS